LNRHIILFDSVNITCINKDCTTGSEPTLKEEFSIEFDKNSQSLFLHTSEKAELLLVNIAGQVMLRTEVSGANS
jgi:hypothetical protein